MSLPISNPATTTNMFNQTHPSGVQVDLPVRNGNKEKLDSLGVQWIGSLKEGSFLAKAELPIGWAVREEPCDFDKRIFTVLDGENVPKASVYMKLAFYDQYARVNVYSDEEAAALKAQFAPKDGQEEFNALLDAYDGTIKANQGCGERGQILMDKAYASLEAFVASHPQFRSELPVQRLCYDDHNRGITTGMMALANTLASSGDMDAFVQLFGGQCV